MARPFLVRAKKYCKKAIKNKTLAKVTLLSCQRFLDDLSRKDVFYIEEAVEEVVDFVQSLHHVTGSEFAGKPFILEDWQIFIITAVFGLHVESKLHSGITVKVRKYNQAQIWVARRNGKSMLASAIALYMLIFDEEGGQIFSAATTRDQARITYDVCRDIIRNTEGLQTEFDIKMPRTARTVGEIYCAFSKAVYKPLSRDSKSLDGLNINCAIIDELHAHKSSDIYDVIVSATGSRLSPLIFVISTAGFNHEGIGYSQYKYCKRVLAGTVDDERLFTVIYELDPEDDWKNPKVWSKANPNMGVSMYEADMVAHCTRAKNSPAEQNNFFVKRCNIWVNSSIAWLKNADLEKVLAKPVKWSDFEGRKVFVGVDLSTRKDITAVCFSGFDPDAEQTIIAKSLFFLPKLSETLTENRDYANWIAADYIVTTDGHTTDHTVVKQMILDTIDDNNLDCSRVVVDAYQSRWLANTLEEKDYEVVEYKQSKANYSEPMKELESLVISGKIAIDKNDCMKWMLQNCDCKPDERQNYYPCKNNSKSKIDGVVALIMSIGTMPMGDETEHDNDNWF